jgi:streptomycin 6-kinase
VTDAIVPALDDQVRGRLERRFGPGIRSWLDELPPVLAALARRWEIRFESLVQRGTVSVVLRCRENDGRARVLKISPDRDRIVGEAAALTRRSTIHVPEVRALDEDVGAILLEAIDPGTPLLLDGGDRRGLVAIDPAPCWGDPAFDAVDLLFWRAEDDGALRARAEQLAQRLDQRSQRLLDWCSAFAAMVALEEAESAGAVEAVSPRLQWLIAYAEAET